MGQLEKYGLYVLCLVIFLILGVAIWGEPAAASPGQREDVVAMRVGGVGSTQVENVTSSRSLRSAPKRSGASQRRMSQDSLDEMLGLEPAIQGSVASVSAGAASKATVKKPVAEVTAKPEPVADVKPKPAVAATRVYKVRKNETLSEIALKQLGSTRYVKQIMAVNPGLTDRIYIGQRIKLPAKKKSSRSRGSAVLDNSVRKYTICPGDNFSRIAKVELGDASRFGEIEALNPNVNPDALQIGKKVNLPLK